MTTTPNPHFYGLTLADGVMGAVLADQSPDAAAVAATSAAELRSEVSGRVFEIVIVGPNSKAGPYLGALRVGDRVILRDAAIVASGIQHGSQLWTTAQMPVLFTSEDVLARVAPVALTPNQPARFTTAELLARVAKSSTTNQPAVTE